MPQLTVGLVGAGGISRPHAAAWRALGATLVVTSLDGAERLAAQYGGTVAASLDDLLARADVVDVVTPTPTHHGIVRRALDAGRAVVCEKPLARTGADAAGLVRQANAAGLALYPGHVVRYFPEYAAMRAAVAAGRIGRPAVLRFNRGGMFPSWAPWFSDVAESGGLLMDQMIHDLDIARWVAGEVVEVFARAHTAERDGHPLQSAHVTLTHASGALSHVQGLWGPPHLRFRTSFHVAGDDGVLRYDSAVTPAVRLDLAPVPDGGEDHPEAPTGESPYLTELREFADAVAGGPAPRVSGADGAVAVWLATAALESLRSGAPVRVDTAALLEEIA